MADKENSVRLTRSGAAARKRAGPAAQTQPPLKKKRPALAEIPNLSNTFPDPKPATRSTESKPKSPPKPPCIDPVDADLDDLQFCPHYATDIYRYLRSMEIELKRRPKGDYIEKFQTDVTASMRGVLVDWLVEVAEEYKLNADTLYHTVSYIDRFLSLNVLNRQRLQLLGISAMLIASKYEEITPPQVEDFCYITDNTYRKQEVVKMESDVLKSLNFEMGNPTIKTFLRKFIKAGQIDIEDPDEKLEILANYLAELSLIEYGCVQFLPSVVAASAVFVARFTINPNENPWSSTLQHQTGYKPSELKDCIQVLHSLQVNKKMSNLVAIREKYKRQKCKYVSMLTSPSDIPASYFESFQE